MKQVIKIVASPSGDRTIDDHRYLTFYDPAGAHGTIKSSADIADALVFDDAAAALTCWRQVSPTHPTRPDGKPNRPLTAFTVEIVKVPE
jgi:hypothetical protein